MMPLADFWDELVGPNWTAQGVASVIVASLAVLGVGANIWVTIHQGGKTRSLSVKHHREATDNDKTHEARRQWWQRFNDTYPRLFQGTDNERAAAVRLLRILARSMWAEDQDKRMVVEVLSAYTGEPKDDTGVGQEGS